MSINAAYYKTRSIKTTACKNYEQVLAMCMANVPGLTELKHYTNFVVDYIFVHPESVFYNKEGRISAKSFDLTNCEKLLQDVLFTTIGADDRFVTRMTSSKVAGHTWEIRVTVTGQI